MERDSVVEMNVLTSEIIVLIRRGEEEDNNFEYVLRKRQKLW